MLFGVLLWQNLAHYDVILHLHCITHNQPIPCVSMYMTKLEKIFFHSAFRTLYSTGNNFQKEVCVKFALYYTHSLILEI